MLRAKIGGGDPNDGGGLAIVVIVVIVVVERQTAYTVRKLLILFAALKHRRWSFDRSSVVRPPIIVKFGRRIDVDETHRTPPIASRCDLPFGSYGRKTVWRQPAAPPRL
jgi:hypothetical protein